MTMNKLTETGLSVPLGLDLNQVTQVGAINNLKYASNREASTLPVMVSRINDIVFKIEVVRPDGNITHTETVVKYDLENTLRNLEGRLRRRSA